MALITSDCGRIRELSQKREESVRRRKEVARLISKGGEYLAELELGEAPPLGFINMNLKNADKHSAHGGGGGGGGGLEKRLDPADGTARTREEFKASYGGAAAEWDAAAAAGGADGDRPVGVESAGAAAADGKHDSDDSDDSDDDDSDGETLEEMMARLRTDVSSESELVRGLRASLFPQPREVEIEVEVSHGLQLQSLWIIPNEAVS